MYFTAFEALEPSDLELLQIILEQTRLDRGLDARDPGLDSIASDLVELWHSGYRQADELKAMLAPLD